MMKTVLLILIIFSIYQQNAWSNFRDEILYDSIIEDLENDNLNVNYHVNRKIQIDAMWDYTSNPENRKKLDKIKLQLSKVNPAWYSLADNIRILRLGVGLSLSKVKLERIKDVMRDQFKGTLTRRDMYLVLNHQSNLFRAGFYEELIDFYKNNSEKIKFYNSSFIKNKPLDSQDLRALVYNSNFKDSKPVLYMFCRYNKIYPCVMILKDAKGDLVRNQDNLIWSKPSLALSKYGLYFHMENGQTPAGIYEINGVMPYANSQLDYGKNRRLIIDFVSSESKVRDIIPFENHQRSWWKESIIAYHVGRHLFRIHGTQRINTEKDSVYYPFYPSLGCVKMREGRYGQINYNDQRELLDELMKAQGLKVQYSSETRIRANMMIINIGDEKRAVTIDEITKLLHEES